MADLYGQPQGDEDFTNLWLIRHIAGLNNSALSAQAAFDIARLPDSIGQTLSDQNVVPTFHKPSLFGELASQIGDRNGSLIPVQDLSAYQQRLNQMGYMPPGYTPNGQWDKATSAAHRAMNNHVGEQIAQGEGGFGSTNPGKALDLLFNAAMPSHISQGIFGALKHLVSSAFGTVERLGKLIAPWNISGRFDIAHHLGEDLLNIVTVASMFVGLGEIVEAGRAGLGLSALSVPELAEGASLGARAGTGLARAGAGAVGLLEPTESVAARLGLVEGRGLSALPAAAEMGPSMTNQLAKWGIQKVGVGSARADAFSQAWTRYMLPRRIAESNLGKIVGGMASGAAKASFIPNAVAIYAPNSPLGKSVREAPHLPWFADLPVIAGALHFPGGVIPKPKDYLGAVGVVNFGHLDPLRGLGDGPVPANVRAALNLDVYAEHLARQKLADMPNFSKLIDADGELDPTAFAKAKESVVKDLVPNYQDAVRGATPDAIKAANAFGEQHPWLVRRRWLDVNAGAQARVSEGRIGSNPIEDWLGATNQANDLTGRLQLGRPNYDLARARVDELKAEQKALLSAPHSEQWDGRVRAVTAELERAKVKLRKTKVAVLFGDIENSGIPVTERVSLMRVDNKATKQGLSALSEKWQQASLVTDDAARQAARDALRPELREIGMGLLPDSKIRKRLDALAHHAATEITERLPPEIQQQFSSRGFKAVIGGHGIILPTDIDPAIAGSYHYSKLAWGLGSMGLSPVPSSPGDIFALTNATAQHALDDYFHGLDAQRFPFGTGGSVVRGLAGIVRTDRAALGEMAQSGGIVRKAFARSLGRLSSVYDASVGDIARALTKTKVAGSPEEAEAMAVKVKQVIRDSAASPGLLRTPSESIGVLDRITQALRVHGLAGVGELIREVSLPHGALLGKIPGNEYGFLPDNLARATMALRFTFNPLFEARLAVKQPVLTGSAENLLPEFRPKARITKLGIQQDVDALSARVFQRNPALLDEAEHTALDGGIWGSNMQNHAKFNMWRVYQREKPILMAGGATAEEADQQIIRYLQENKGHFLGYGARAPAEKSVNFMFFPFSFEKKLLGQVSDWLSAEPVRVLLAHHAMKRLDMVNKMGPDHQTAIARFIRERLPLFREVDKLNAFRHISIGEFGGVYGPLAKTLALPLDAVRGAFHPVGVEGDGKSLVGAGGLLSRLVPAYKALDDMISDFSQQGQVLTSTQHMTTKGQLDHFFMLLHATQQRAIDTATAFGATPTLQGFANSQKIPEVFRQQYDSEKLRLEQLYPKAAAYATRFAADQAKDDVMIRQILGKPNKSAFDFGVVAMEALRAELDALPTSNPTTPSARLLQTKVVHEAMRREGLRLFALLGDSWNDVWQHLGYENDFGPLAMRST